MSAVPESDDLIGRRIGGYVVVKLIGEGGMGRVYLARHPTMGKQIAVKVLHAWVAKQHPHIVARFQNEATAIAALGHPNILDVIDCSAFDDGTPYITMEFLQGESLGSAIARGPLDVLTTVTIIVPICAAVHAAHLREIVHRDIKPENIYLQRGADGSLVPKLLDFGIARLRGDLAPAAGVKTATNAVMGTPVYMSPEQARGQSLDHRSDIYSLAVVLFEMLLGHRPFPGQSLAEHVLAQHTTDPPDPSRLRPEEVPAALGAVIVAALARDPADRPPSAHAFAHRIIDAVPGAREIAEQVAPSLFKAAPPSAATLTVSAPGHPVGAPPSPVVPGEAGYAGPGRPPTMPLPGATPPPGNWSAQPGATVPLGPSRGAVAPVVAPLSTTPMEGATPSIPAAPRTASRAWLAPAGVVLVLLLAAGGWLLLRGAGGSGEDGDSRALDTTLAAAGAGAIDAGPVPATPAAPPPADAAVARAADAAPTPVPVASADAGVPPAPSPPGHREETRTGMLSVSVEPWAVVYLDGKRLGSTPLDRSVPAGRHRLLLVNEDRRKRENITIKVQPGRTTTIERTW